VKLTGSLCHAWPIYNPLRVSPVRAPLDPGEHVERRGSVHFDSLALAAPPNRLTAKAVN